MKKIIPVLIIISLIAVLCGVLVSCGPKYDVALDYNGGELKGKTGTNLSKYEGKDVNLSKYKPVRDGYDLLRWQDTDGNVYGVDDKVRIEGEITLTAVWTSKLVYELASDGESYTVTGTTDNASYLADDLTVASEYSGKPVTAVASEAFKGCRSVKSISIPDSVTQIGGGAFNGCVSLTSITLPFAGRTATETDGANYGLPYLFGGQGGTYSNENNNKMPHSLTTVIISDAATFIPDWAIGNCNYITDVVLGKNITSIGTRAFNDCRALVNITLPAKCNEVKQFAFYGDINAKIVVEGSIARLGQYAFANTRLESVTLLSMSSIPTSAFTGTDLREIVIPGEVRTIGIGAFQKCTKLTRVIILGDSVTLSQVSFAQCPLLTADGIDLSKVVISEDATGSNSPFQGSGVSI
ncbi:MAG: leucine-rich repeat domain-containing protein [Clostridia bacterium]|nr:leucine-rich repeat domain-containing protein [Clostridia bacterium]